MSCYPDLPLYLSHSKEGLNFVTVDPNQATSINLDWTEAFVSSNQYQLLYNIYYSTKVENVFSDGPKFVSIDHTILTAYLIDIFTPGQLYYFAVRAAQYDPQWYDLSILPDVFPNDSPGLKSYPEGVLTQDISAIDLVIHISDPEVFPPKGILQIGYEFVRYESVNISDGYVKCNNVSDRGFLNTNARSHTVSGFDGYNNLSSIITFFNGLEEKNTVIFESCSVFQYPSYPFTKADGYRVVAVDNLNTNLSADEADQITFPTMDFSSYRRDNPTDVLSGICVGSYIFGESFCSDSYGIGFAVRGIGLVEQSDRRLEELLTVDGERVNLVRRKWTGLTCPCMKSTAQNPSLRCKYCFGVGLEGGYDQYFYPRYSDGKILCRFSPVDDILPLEDFGLQSGYSADVWTLSTPIIKVRDYLVRYNFDGTEEYRYEVTNVQRNKLINDQAGAQKIKVVRRKVTDPIYSFPITVTTAEIPKIITTGIGLLRGSNNLLQPHSHTIVISEGITLVSQINQMTSVSLNHSHIVRNGIMEDEGLGHTHSISLI